MSSEVATPATAILSDPVLVHAVSRAERRNTLISALLIAPSVAFVAAFLVAPIGLFLFKAVDNGELRRLLTHSIAALEAQQDSGPPTEAFYEGMVDDLRQIEGTASVGMLARRLNYVVPGFRSLITKTATNLPPPEAKSKRSALVEIDPRWSDPRFYSVIRQQKGRWTSFYLLSALDLERLPDDSIRRVAPEQAVFMTLYGRTLEISIMVTAICLIIGYPVAAVIAGARPSIANALLLFVMIPFWSSLLVRSTAWVILLQGEGLVNKVLVGIGALRTPMELVFNRFGVVIAMVHVLLPYMILPLYSVMKGISANHIRAAASLGAAPARVFWTVYFPLSMPGVAAGCTLVFVLAVGFYVTPALVGGPSDQMIGYFIAYFTNSAVNWGLASALGALLLFLVAAIYTVLGRVVGLDALKVR